MAESCGWPPGCSLPALGPGLDSSSQRLGLMMAEPPTHLDPDSGLMHQEGIHVLLLKGLNWGLGPPHPQGESWAEARGGQATPPLLTLPSWVSRMESLLMSRWMTPWAWSTDRACSTARHTAAICSSFILGGQGRWGARSEWRRQRPHPGV